MSANSVFRHVDAIKCLMSLRDYHQNGTVSMKSCVICNTFVKCGHISSNRCRQMAAMH